jgi:alpha-tubulin suppressor-like RCC1 family protein
LSNVISVSAKTIYGGYGAYSLALLNDGTVRGFGFPTTATIPSNVSNVSQIAASPYAALALRRDGTVVGWGDNHFGHLNVPTNLSNVVSIGAGVGSGLAVHQDGTVTAWGRGSGTNLPADLNSVAAISAFGAGAFNPDGVEYVAALRSNGTVVVWGGASSAVTNVPAAATNVVQVEVGSRYALALKADGTVISWGEPIFYATTNVPANLNNVVSISAGEYVAAAVTRDGTIVAWGSALLTNTPPGLSNVAAASVGTDHALALTIPPQITGISLSNEQLAIQFPSFSGQNYTLERTTNLNGNHWTNFIDSITGIGREITIVDTNIIPGIRFYRLRVE